MFGGTVENHWTLRLESVIQLRFVLGTSQMQAKNGTTYASLSILGHIRDLFPQMTLKKVHR
jgi:hypothetical protein